MKKYLQLIRIKHWAKNLLIFVPLIFSENIWNINKVLLSFIAFLSFSLIASSVYIFNDLKDIEKDRKHPIKKNRPLASGKVSIAMAKIIFSALIILSIVITFFSFNFINVENLIIFIILEFVYLLINIAYSKGLKNIPIIDVVILAFGFVIRVFLGSVIISVPISNFLYLTIMSGAFFMGFGKRRNEYIKEGNKTREVLKKYNSNFLDKFMYMCLTLTVVFYSMWSIDSSTIERVGNNFIVFTIPLVLIVFMKYSLNIEGDSYGDPIDVILSDKMLMGITILYILSMIFIIYVI